MRPKELSVRTLLELSRYGGEGLSLDHQYNLEAKVLLVLLVCAVCMICKIGTVVMTRRVECCFL